MGGAASALGQSIEASVNLGLGASDNVDLATGNHGSTTLTTAGLQLSALHETPRLKLDAVGALSYLDYSGGARNSEVVGSLQGRTSIALVENALDWTLTENFSQMRRNQVDVPSPVNRQNVNTISTGPDVRIRLGSRVSAILQGRYSRTDLEYDDTGSRRWGATAGVAREISSGSTLAVIFNTELTHAESIGLPNTYRWQEAYAQYELYAPMTDFRMQAGANRLIDGTTTTKEHLRFEVSRRLSQLSVLRVSAGRVFSDLGSSSTIDQAGRLSDATLQAAALALPGLPFLSDSASLEWAIEGRRTTIGIGASWRRENYLDPAANDRRRLDVSGLASRQLSAAITARSDIVVARTHLNGQSGSFNELSGAIGLNWKLGRRISVDWESRYFRADNNILGQKADEMRHWIRLRYGKSIMRPLVPESRQAGK
jgi:hypothetical protein